MNKKMDSDIETKNTGQAVLQPARFEKKQLLISKKYAPYRDLVEALLDDKKMYTITEVDNLINKYRKGTVK